MVPALIPNSTTGTELWSHVSHDALWRTVDLAQRSLGCTTALVSSFTAGARIVRATAGDDTNLPPSAFCEHVLARDVAIVADAVTDHPAFGTDRGVPTVAAYLGVPLRRWDGQLIGTVCVADMRSRHWSDDDLMLVEALAAHLIATIETSAKPTSAGSLDGRSPPLEPVSAGSGSDASVSAVGRILLADDLDLNRRLIADMLAIEGHVVDCVIDGAAAVAAAGTVAYDLILMDMIMPGMDGIAATRAIRALPAPAGTVPIVALTANSYPEQLESCIAAGMNATLTKPMSLDALTTAVRIWLRNRGRPVLLPQVTETS